MTTASTLRSGSQTGGFACHSNFYGFTAKAELPRWEIDTTPITSFAATYVETAATLQARIAAIRSIGTASNYKIRVADGETCTAANRPTVMPLSGGSTGWIQIEPASLPGIAGMQVTPADFTTQAKFYVSNNGDPAIEVQAGANNVRLVGLHALFDPSYLGFSNHLVTLGDSANTNPALVNQNIIVERCYFHGNSTQDLKRCIEASAAYCAVIDSYCSDAHTSYDTLGQDAQAFWSGNGTGPYLLQNSYLEGAGENVLFGGASPNVPGLEQADITVRRCHIAKPRWLRSESPAWVNKNLLEFKHASRVLVTGCVLENEFGWGQDATGILIESVDQEGQGPQSRTMDLVFTYNAMRSVGGGFAISRQSAYPIIPQPYTVSRVVFAHNVFWDIATEEATGVMHDIAAKRTFLSTAYDLQVVHNTFLVASDNATTRLAEIGEVSAGQGNRGLYVRNNIMFAGGYELTPSDPVYALSHQVDTPTWDTNVIIGTDTAGVNWGTYRSTNYFPATYANVGFADVSITVGFAWSVKTGASVDSILAKLALASGPYRAGQANQASDGTDQGADMVALRAAIAGVMTGDYGPPPPPPPVTAPVVITPAAGLVSGRKAQRQPVVAVYTDGVFDPTATGTIVVTVQDDGNVNVVAGDHRVVIKGYARFTKLTLKGAIGQRLDGIPLTYTLLP